MLKSRLNMAPLVAAAGLAASSLADILPRVHVPTGSKPYHRPTSHKERSEIAAWNAAVEAKKNAKRGRA